MKRFEQMCVALGVSMGVLGLMTFFFVHTRTRQPRPFNTIKVQWGTEEVEVKRKELMNFTEERLDQLERVRAGLVAGMKKEDFAVADINDLGRLILAMNLLADDPEVFKKPFRRTETVSVPRFYDVTAQVTMSSIAATCVGFGLSAYGVVGLRRQQPSATS